MATEVLRPTDLLAERYRLHPTPFHRRENSPANRKNHRKASSSPPKPDKRISGHNGGGARLVSGQVTLLKRGEPLSPIAPRTATGNPSDPIRNPIEDPTIARRIPPPADTYAGSAFSMSPSPRSVPLPSFFSRDSNDGATRDLRRLLRLE